MDLLAGYSDLRIFAPDLYLAFGICSYIVLDEYEVCNGLWFGVPGW
jgi:hypothetical protein